MSNKAFHISADPDQDIRDQEELAWNIDNLNEFRLDLQYADKELCRVSNKNLRKENKHKIRLKDFSCLITYKDFHTHRSKHRSQLPTSEYTREQIDILCKNKRFQWKPGLMFVGQKTGGYYYAQQYPMLVLDIDNIDFDTLVEKLNKDWKLNIPFSLVPSSSGTGAHLHIWLDLTNCPCPTPSGTPHEIVMAYRNSYRYQALTALKMAFAKSIEKDTGVKVDEAAVYKDTIAITPEEIDVVNRFWKSKSPIPVPLPVIQKAVNKYDSLVERRARRHLDNFVVEFDKMLSDLDIVDEILKYLQLTGVNPGKRDYYEQVIRALRSNRDEVVAHWARNLHNLWWLRSKKEDVSIGRETGAKQLFGFESKKNLTYFRQVGQYIWSLAKSKDYVYRKKTNLFVFIDISKKYFTGDFLVDNWYIKPRVIEELDVDHIADKMGNGKTWSTICDLSPHVRYFFGDEKGLSIMLSAIEMSCAKDKKQRREQVCRFFNHMKRGKQRVRQKQAKTG